jgi:hypothetical protein
MTGNKSEIACLLQRIELKEAAQRGLYGLAIVASHELITARMERGAERILQLITEGKHDEAVALMNTETWGIEIEEEKE